MLGALFVLTIITYFSVLQKELVFVNHIIDHILEKLIVFNNKNYNILKNS